METLRKHEKLTKAVLTVIGFIAFLVMCNEDETQSLTAFVIQEAIGVSVLLVCFLLAGYLDRKPCDE